MRIELDSRVLQQVLGTLTLLSVVAVFNPGTALASEHANQTLVFEGAPSEEVDVPTRSDSMLIASLSPQTPDPKPQPVYEITKQENFQNIATTKTPPKNTGGLKPGQMVVNISSYTSSPEECWGNPFITASGAHVHMGTAAWNGVPFGTQFKIPELTGDLVYTVEDRGSMRVMGTHTIDLWRPTKAEAFAIGRRQATIEIL